MISDPEKSKKLSKNEGIKEQSNFLRGTILDGLSDSSTGLFLLMTHSLQSFMGLILQDNRDRACRIDKGEKRKSIFLS